jgi:subtilisin family serine protease/Ca2+-binding RTX toxin-like protein
MLFNQLNFLNHTLNLTYQELSSFASGDNFWQVFNTSFGTTYNITASEILRSQWQNNDFTQLPEIEVISSSILDNANGAYASSTNKIYLSDNFLSTATSAALKALLLEEIGHYVDGQINNIDSQGDEGAIFAALIQGESLDQTTLQNLKTENDHSIMTLNGQNIQIEQQTTNPPIFVANQIVIKFQRDISQEQIKALQTELGAKVTGNIPKLDIQLWDISNLTVEQAIEQYSQDQRIQFIEPNYTNYELAAPIIPNDPSFNSLWGLNNIGQTGGTVDADIDAPEAWGQLQGWGWFPNTGNAVVGVIDTGVDYNHPDLINNIWTNPGEIASNGIDDDGNGYIDDVRGWDFYNNDNTPTDGYGHGTHVAGTIGAQGNNALGVTGVNWKVKIMPIQIFSASGAATTTFNIAQAIQYATNNGADLTNNSWGGGPYSAAIYSAIQAGPLFVAAAGNYANNNDITPFYPATYNLNNIISVAATDHNDLLASFSHYGLTTVDLGAPGVNIYSTLPTGGSVMGTNYGAASGTSMATPHVAGAAALIVATRRQRGLPDLTDIDLKQKVLNGVDVIPSLIGKAVTGGRLNLDSGVNQSGVGWGDVHLITFDGKHYDFQASGEFIFAESERLGDDWVVQTRQKPWIFNTSVSVNTAFATLVDGHRVVFDLDFANRLQIDGINFTLKDSESQFIGNSLIQRSNNYYTLTYAGDDGIIDDADAQLKALDNGNHINLEVLRFGNVQGLLGDNDGNPNNDFALRDRTLLSANPTWDEIHGKFADSWRVRFDENLFNSDQIPVVPPIPKFISLNDLDPVVVDAARKAIANAGIPQGELFDRAVFDFAVTGDERFINGAAAFFAPSISLTVTPEGVIEDGTTNLIYTFTRTGATTTPLTVNYKVAGTATFNTDYTQIGAASFTSTTGTITFGENASTATLIIDPKADITIENNETVALTLATGIGYTIDTTNTVNGVILNDDFINQSPTDLNLSNSNIGENLPVGTIIGNLSTIDPNSANTFIYSLVAGTGATDNALFSITGNQLKTKAIFNFEAKNSYSILLRTTDQGGLFFDKQFTIGITNVNETPTNITLSNSNIAENQEIGTLVGNLITTDPDANNTFTYSLVTGTGATDNASFTIVGNQLQTNGVFNFESKKAYSIRVRTTDQDGLFFEKVLPIGITNVNETPTNINLSATTVAENLAIGTLVGNLTSIDPDVGNTFTYSLVPGTVAGNDNSFFNVVGTQLKTNAIFNFENKNSYSILLRTTDQGGLFFDKAFTIGVTNVNETPTNLTLSNNIIDENKAINTLIGLLNTTDPDASNTFTYSLVAGTGATDNALFSITGNQLKNNAVFDFETKNSYSIRLRTTDQGGLFVEKQLTININNIDYTIIGTINNENFTATAEKDTINGQGGNDTITATFVNLKQNDNINGNIGTDTLIITGGANLDTISIDANSIINQVDILGTTVLGFENFNLSGFLGETSFYGTINIDTVKTGAGDDYIVTGDGNDNIDSGSGNDYIDAGSGNDTLNGGTGDDILIGGNGNDIYVVDSIGDVIVEALNAGIDTVQSSISYILKNNIENLTLTGISAINGAGNNLNNTINGNSGDNILIGGAGIDTLTGNAGNDILVGGIGNDVLTGGLGADIFRFNATNEGLDNIKDFKVAELDIIQVSDAGFGGSLVVGTLDVSQFVSGAGITSATNSLQRFIYNTTNGALFYDADGNGLGSSALQIATLTGLPVINSSHIAVIA